MQYDWILFDADGTLFDYDRAEALALERTFGQLVMPFQPVYVAAYRQVNAAIWREFEAGSISQERLRTRRFELLFEAIGLKPDPQSITGQYLPQVFSVCYLKNLARGTQLVQGATEVVKTLHGKAGLVLITNGLHEVQRPRLAKSAIGRYFSVVLISEELGCAKPDRAIFDVAFEKMGQPAKARVLIVGDSLTSDIKGGNDYGIDTCWYNPGRQKADPSIPARYEIERLDELLPIILYHKGLQGL